MRAFTKITAVAAPLDRSNVDTDMIIPKQFLKSIKRSGFGKNLFDELRYLDEGRPDESCEGRPINPEFVLNQPVYQSAQILLARENFGCGSSREHAPWALEDFGIRVIIAPSFADIFYNNCFKNGLLPIELDAETVDSLFALAHSEQGAQLNVDLETQTITQPDGEVISFEIDEFRRHCLLNGLDNIGLTLQHADKIAEYEANIPSFLS